MTRKKAKPYHIERTTEGCDEVFLVIGPGSERPIVAVAFWEAEAEAFAVARRVTAALNACEGIATEELEETVMVAKKPKPYWYQRYKDRWDESFNIYGPGDERPIVGVDCWEAEAEAEADARRITAAFNAYEGIATEELEKTVMVAKKSRTRRGSRRRIQED